MNLPDDGYGVSTGYTYGYYRRLSPTWLRLMAAVHSVPFPEGEPFRYFELGYGQGVSLNVHAATNPGEYWGTDYNPEHVQFARRMAEASGAPVHLLDLSFEELAERDDLPQFQVIVAHGIWSWISDASRAAVLRFVDKHLAPGGLLYLSYNALPGAASGIAVQRLIRTLMQSMDPALSERERFDHARDTIRDLGDAPHSHFAHYPKAGERLEKILQATSTYALHEYTVDAWKPMLLTEVAAALDPIGLEFVGNTELDPRTAWQATSGGQRDDVAATTDQTAFSPLVLREVLCDFEVDRQFRNDLFVRGLVRLDTTVRTRLLMEQRFALTRHADVVEFVADEASDEEDATLCRDLLIAFSNRPDGIATVSEIASLLPAAGAEPILRSILLCAKAEALHPASNRAVEIDANQSRDLNKLFASEQGANPKIALAASPAIGAGIPNFVPEPDFEAAINQGAKTASELIEYAINNLNSRKFNNRSSLSLLTKAASYVQHRKVITDLGITII